MPEPQHAASEHDPISVASARMFARGVPGSDRMEALKLLGVLMDHAQSDGTVLFDADVLAAELEAGLNESHRYYRWLEATGVLVRDRAGWRIEGFAPSAGAVSNAAAIDVLAEFLERERADKAGAPAPSGRSPERRPEAEPALPAIVPLDSHPRRRALPALAGVAAAAVIVWVVALVNTPTGPTATQVAIDEPLARAATREPGTIMLAAPKAVTRGGTSAASEASAAAGSDTPAVPGAGPTGGLASCAPSRPKLRIERVDVVSTDKADAEQSGVPAGWLVLVSGTIENAGRAPIEVRAFDVDVDTETATLSTSGLHAPVMLPAGTGSPWTTMLYAGREQPSAPKAQALLRDWSVAGPASC